MIGIREEFDGCTVTKLSDHCLQELRLGKVIALSLEKQHRDVNVAEVFAAII